MTPSEIQRKKLQFLVRVVSRECKHLAATDAISLGSASLRCLRCEKR